LHEIIRFVQGAQHAVTMQFDFPAERLGEPFKRLVRMRRSLLLMRWFRCFHCD
jgi:hypothetical protein